MAADIVEHIAHFQVISKSFPDRQRQACAIITAVATRFSQMPNHVPLAIQNYEHFDGCSTHKSFLNYTPMASEPF
jgi:hypothetical protein